MDFIVRNQGLLHISEEIFSNLDHTHLVKCQNVNIFWKNTLDNFWLRKCLRKGLLTKKVQLTWTKLFQLPKNPYVWDKALFYLMEIHEKKLANHTPIQMALYHFDLEMIRFAAPLQDNPNEPFPVGSLLGLDGWTPIQVAAKKKYDEILEILAPLADNLDAPAPDGMTPTTRAVMCGYGNIFRVLNKILCLQLK